ncbi:unnamed protein product [Macrosiphum euphorbiae]|uniref:Uncharacterized protein n=1 Tax=Macrosiphum euphorbiae TaxID=13131 RepID=A0AAV0XLR7_9HEMI|nr:unnamed protein product [Macrosiphum euphorbiae]
MQLRHHNLHYQHQHCSNLHSGARPCHRRCATSERRSTAARRSGCTRPLGTNGGPVSSTGRRRRRRPAAISWPASSDCCPTSCSLSYSCPMPPRPSGTRTHAVVHHQHRSRKEQLAVPAVRGGRARPRRPGIGSSTLSDWIRLHKRYYYLGGLFLSGVALFVLKFADDYPTTCSGSVPAAWSASRMSL